MDEYEKQAIDLFTKILRENSLIVGLSNPVIKRIEGGGIIIDTTNITVQFTPERLKELQITKEEEIVK